MLSNLVPMMAPRDVFQNGRSFDYALRAPLRMTEFFEMKAFVGMKAFGGKAEFVEMTAFGGKAEFVEMTKAAHCQQGVNGTTPASGRSSCFVPSSNF